MKPIDPILSLAISLVSNPGVYALLVGSGVSRSAGVFTGWEITLDLACKLANLQSEDPGSNPAAWYRAKYGIDPNYSEILAALGATNSERSAILRSYFEPTADERSQNTKTPTATHRAIAKLVKLGLVRMIITTNFDRLLEISLSDEGIVPDVISSDDSLQGANPYVHSKCMIIKVHGDYRDTRIKNTEAELSQYSEQLNRLLDRVLDEFGLLICGWSGEYDIALVNAILRNPSRRYSTYWLKRGELEDNAQKIITQRKAIVIAIEGAEKFFPALFDHVSTLLSFNQPHPLSKENAIATVKRYLEDPSFRVKLEDLISEEARNLRDRIQADETNKKRPSDKDALLVKLGRYEADSEILISIILTLIKYDRQGIYVDFVVNAMKTILSFTRDGRPGVYSPLQYYPAVFVFYSVAIVALELGNYKYLAALMLNVTAKDEERKETPAIWILNPVYIFHDRQELKRVLDPEGRVFTPAHNYMFGRLKNSLREYFFEEKELEFRHDLLEFLIGMVHIDIFARDEAEPWAPAAMLGWKFEYSRGFENRITQHLNINAKSLLQVGFFDGNQSRLEESSRKYWSRINRLGWR